MDAAQLFKTEANPNIPKFGPGDTVKVNFRIREGERERIQVFQGVVIRLNNGKGPASNFTVRRISGGIGIERKDDGEILGFCGLKRSNQAGGPLGMMEAGWRLREDAWDKGYAREAATASLDLAFDRFGADEVIAMTVQRNTASWGLMQRLGMRRREDLDFDNAEFDEEDPVIIVYSVDRESWMDQNG